MKLTSPPRRLSDTRAPLLRSPPCFCFSPLPWPPLPPSSHCSACFFSVSCRGQSPHPAPSSRCLSLRAVGEMIKMLFTSNCRQRRKSKTSASPGSAAFDGPDHLQHFVANSSTAFRATIYSRTEALLGIAEGISCNFVVLDMDSLHLLCSKWDTFKKKV